MICLRCKQPVLACRCKVRVPKRTDQSPEPWVLELRHTRLRACMDALGGDPTDPEAAIVVGMLVTLYGVPADPKARDGKETGPP